MDKDREYRMCPLNSKLCVGGINDRAPRHPLRRGEKLICRWWQHLAGKDPQTEANFDMWDCAVAWLPITTIETSQMSRQAGASMDKVANVVHEVGRKIVQLGLERTMLESNNLPDRPLPRPGILNNKVIEEGR